MANKSKIATKPAPVRKPTKRELSANNFVAIVAAVCVITILGAGFIANALIHDVITNAKLVLKKQQALKDVSTKLDNAPKLIEAYNNLGSTRTLINHALPTTSDFPQLVALTESMGNASGVTVRTVGPSVSGTSTPTTGAPVAQSGSAAAQQYAYTVNIEGAYQQILAFIKNIEQSARPMRVKTIQFHGDSVVITADLEIITYFQGEADISDKTEVVK